MTWMQFESGASIGTEGSEAGTIVADCEHELGARITIERDGANSPFSITCGIYGWFFHSRFFSTRKEADVAYAETQSALAAIIQSIPLASDPEYDVKSSEVIDAIANFIDIFP